MTIYDFELRYTFITFDDENNKVKIHFFPLSKGMTTGAMNTTFADGIELGGEYSLEEFSDGRLYISWTNARFLFIQTEFGFNLVNHETSAVTYSFARPIV